MTKKIRVAQIIGKWVGGGVEANIMNYYRRINKSKVEFDFICDADSTNIPYDEIIKLGGKVILVPPYQSIFKYQKELKRVLMEGNYDIAHSHLNTLSVFSLRAAKKAHIKHRVAHSHSTTNKKELKRTLIKNCLKMFSKVYATDYMACSKDAGIWLFGEDEYLNGEVTILNNAIDLKVYDFDLNRRHTTRDKLDIKRNTTVIGIIGRLVEQKNHRFLIDIFNEYLKLNSNAYLLIIGNGPLENELRTYVMELNIQDKVIFTGHVTDPENYYNAMDCYIMPSLYEGLGMVLIEAQACGLPTLTSNMVPKEAKLTNLLQYVSLEKKPRSWAKKADLMIRNNNRTSYKDEITKKGYNIDNNVKVLEKYYIKLCAGDSNDK